MNLPDCMYDYRTDFETVTYIGDCYVCGVEIYSNDDYRYRNGALMHDECLDEYEEEDEDYD